MTARNRLVVLQFIRRKGLSISFFPFFHFPLLPVVVVFVLDPGRFFLFKILDLLFLSTPKRELSVSGCVAALMGMCS